MSPESSERDTSGIRLQKVLASAGLGSRRACEVLIEEGRVEVDGEIVVEQGMRVDPARSAIKVDGRRIVAPTEFVYLALNKPRGVVSTMSDPEGRPTVADYVAERSARVFHVGRLDVDSEGLLLMTNDGELGHRLAHPAYDVAKTYLVEVPGPVGRSVLTTLRRGVELDDGRASVDAVRIVDAAQQKVLLEVVIHSGRKRVVRRMMEAVEHPVSRLLRVQIGPVQLGNLKPGRSRHLTTHEVGSLYQLVGM